MKTAIIVPFDHATQSPVLPTDKDGQPTWISWGRKSKPTGDSIMVEIEASELVVIPLKLDLKVCWLEDFDPPKVAPVPIGMTVELEKEIDLETMEADLDGAVDTEAEKQTDAEVVKAYLTVQTKVPVSALTKQAWDTPDNIIISAAKLHGQTMENYCNSGLG